MLRVVQHNGLSHLFAKVIKERLKASIVVLVLGEHSESHIYQAELPRQVLYAVNRVVDVFGASGTLGRPNLIVVFTLLPEAKVLANGA